MAVNLNKAVTAGLDFLFGVAGELVRAAEFVRPAGASPIEQSGNAQQTANVKAFITDYRSGELGTVVIQPADEKVLVRAVDLALIISPGNGDYLVETLSGQRRDVLSARLDAAGLLWTLHTVRSINDDWGVLTATTASADWGDLATATDAEDWLGLT